MSEYRPAPGPTKHQERADMALNSKRILLVDDDEISRLVAFEVLTHLGAAVDLAAMPEDAMRLLGWQRYDLIMLDLFMPTLSGIELANIMIAIDGSLALLPRPG